MVEQRFCKTIGAKKLHRCIVIFLLAASSGFAQDFGISVSAFLKVNPRYIEITKSNQKEIGQQVFARGKRGEDGRPLAHDYEEERYFINDKLYAIITDRVITQREADAKIAEYKKTYTGTMTPRRDAYWIGNNYRLSNEKSLLVGSVLIPTETYNQVVKFSPGQVHFSFSSYDYTLQKEYSKAYDTKKLQDAEKAKTEAEAKAKAETEENARIFWLSLERAAAEKLEADKTEAIIIIKRFEERFENGFAVDKNNVLTRQSFKSFLEVYADYKSLITQNRVLSHYIIEGVQTSIQRYSDRMSNSQKKNYEKIRVYHWRIK